jgi:hypothetical protein
MSRLSHAGVGNADVSRGGGGGLQQLARAQRPAQVLSSPLMLRHVFGRSFADKASCLNLKDRRWKVRLNQVAESVPAGCPTILGASAGLGYR